MPDDRESCVQHDRTSAISHQPAAPGQQDESPTTRGLAGLRYPARPAGARMGVGRGLVGGAVGRAPRPRKTNTMLNSSLKDYVTSRILPEIQTPAQYIGGERHSV